MIKKDCGNTEHEKSSLESVLTLNDDTKVHHAEEPCSMISFETVETPLHTEIIRQPSPPPVLAEVQDLIPAMSAQVIGAEYGMENPSPDSFVRSESPLQLHFVRFDNI